MRKDHSGPVFPTPWTNDGDMAAHAPDGQVAPPGGTVMLEGITQRTLLAALLAPKELNDRDAEILLQKGEPSATRRAEWLQWRAEADALWRVMQADAILTAAAITEKRRTTP